MGVLPLLFGLGGWTSVFDTSFQPGVKEKVPKGPGPSPSEVPALMWGSFGRRGPVVMSRVGTLVYAVVLGRAV